MHISSYLCSHSAKKNRQVSNFGPCLSQVNLIEFLDDRLSLIYPLLLPPPSSCRRCNYPDSD